MKQKGKQPVKKVEGTVMSSSILSNPRFHYAIIISSIALLYLPSLQYQFTYYDDTTLVENMRQFIRSGHHFTEIFSQSVFGSSPGSRDYYYRPILTLSLYLDAMFSETSLLGFHLTNILIHIAIACLLYLFLLKMKINSQLSFAGSLLFAVHPALVQAIAWIPGRNDSLLTLFALASLLFLIKYFGSRKLVFLMLHLMSFFLALLTKETAVFLPVLYFLVIKISENEKTVKKSSGTKNFSITAFLISWVVLCILFFILRRSILGTSVGLPLNFTIENFFKNLPAVVQYIGKMMLPFNLSTFPILQDTTFIFGIISIIVLLYFLYTSKSIRRNYLLAGSSWLLLFLFPAILRTSSDYESVFLEHRLYFPIIGFFLLWLETDMVKNMRLEDTSPKIALGCIVALFVILSFNHSRHYKDEFNYWSKAVATSPNASFAHRGLGTYYVTAGKSAEAEKEYETALQLNPDLKEVRNNLGRIYLNNGQNEKAELLFDDELKINPSNAVAYYNLALLRLNQKNVVKAESLVRKALELDPEYVDAQNDLCVILAMQKKYEEATQLCIKMLENNPSYESARKNLVLIFNAWDDGEKISYYKDNLKQMGVTL